MQQQVNSAVTAAVTKLNNAIAIAIAEQRVNKSNCIITTYNGEDVQLYSLTMLLSRIIEKYDIYMYYANSKNPDTLAKVTKSVLNMCKKA
jgi:hypothetical protein